MYRDQGWLIWSRSNNLSGSLYKIHKNQIRFKDQNGSWSKWAENKNSDQLYLINVRRARNRYSIKPEGNMDRILEKRVEERTEETRRRRRRRTTRWWSVDWFSLHPLDDVAFCVFKPKRGRGEGPSQRQGFGSKCFFGSAGYRIAFANKFFLRWTQQPEECFFHRSAEQMSSIFISFRERKSGEMSDPNEWIRSDPFTTSEGGKDASIGGAKKCEN